MKQYNKGIENPCVNCKNCNCGLRIGHAFEFYELIDDNKEKKEKNEDVEEEEEEEGEEGEKEEEEGK